jgi:hypothetical protein
MSTRFTGRSTGARAQSAPSWSTCAQRTSCRLQASDAASSATPTPSMAAALARRRSLEERVQRSHSGAPGHACANQTPARWPHHVPTTKGSAAPFEVFMPTLADLAGTSFKAAREHAEARGGMLTGYAREQPSTTGPSWAVPFSYLAPQTTHASSVCASLLGSAIGRSSRAYVGAALGTQAAGASCRHAADGLGRPLRQMTPRACPIVPQLARVPARAQVHNNPGQRVARRWPR